MIIFLYWLMIFVFVAYISYIIIRFGIQKSISHTAYLDNNKYMFSLFTISYAFLASILSLLVFDSILLLLTSLSLMYVAGAYNYLKVGTINEKVHIYSAFISAILSQLSIIFVFKMWYVVIINLILLGIVQFSKIKNKIWWQEIILLLSLFTLMGVKILL